MPGSLLFIRFCFVILLDLSFGHSKTRKPKAKRRKLTTTSVERKVTDENLGDGDPKDVAQRYILKPFLYQKLAFSI